ncbi:hypothetical protein WN51_05222 [Melipona quadrifasciata]|uniref:Uncharacterized protein n=1 Tax=Melipona quadrifasciata TaxID=166423 RepID=A0A0N0BDJ6_9HYME|nr:hypothetical protein WN51_05222 [Melipona quadrifasciata]
MGQILMKRGAHKLVSRLMGYQLHPAIALGAKISLESITPANPPPGMNETVFKHFQTFANSLTNIPEMAICAKENVRRKAGEEKSEGLSRLGRGGAGDVMQDTKAGNGVTLALQSLLQNTQKIGPLQINNWERHDQYRRREYYFTRKSDGKDEESTKLQPNKF